MISEISVGLNVQIVVTDSTSPIASHNKKYGVVEGGSGPFSIKLDGGEVIPVPPEDILLVQSESFDTNMFELLSTYDRSSSGYVYYLLSAKGSGNLYFQMVNLADNDVQGPYFVGSTNNNEAEPKPATNNDESYDLSNTIFTMEDSEKNRRLDRGTVVIHGHTNSDDRDSYRYICTRIGGPWKRQRIFREIN